jgi:hypothetical protein
VLGYRNGDRFHSLTIQVWCFDLLIPKVLKGSFLPSFLEPDRWVKQTLYTVALGPYSSGV